MVRDDLMFTIRLLKDFMLKSAITKQKVIFGDKQIGSEIILKM